MPTLSAHQVAAEIRSRVNADKMKVQKLLYFAQAIHYAETDQPLFVEKVKAWKDGPVVPDVWQADRKNTTWWDRPEEVTEFQTAILDWTVAEYGHLSPLQLRALTHRAGGPWERHYAGPVTSNEIPLAEMIEDIEHLGIKESREEAQRIRASRPDPFNPPPLPDELVAHLLNR